MNFFGVLKVSSAGFEGLIVPDVDVGPAKKRHVRLNIHVGSISKIRRVWLKCLFARALRKYRKIGLTVHVYSYISLGSRATSFTEIQKKHRSYRVKKLHIGEGGLGVEIGVSEGWRNLLKSEKASR